jgi:hypothetical protein
MTAAFGAGSPLLGELQDAYRTSGPDAGRALMTGLLAAAQLVKLFLGEEVKRRR